MGAQCTMAANSSSILSRVCSLLLVWVALKDFGDRPFQWTFMSDLMLFPIYTGAFGKPQGLPKGSILVKSLYPSTPRCRTKSMWMSPHTGPNSSYLAARRSTSPRSGALLSLTWMNLKVWWLKSSSSQMTGIKYIHNHGPWTNSGPSLYSWEP